MLTLGIDSGSRAVKAVLFDSSTGRVMANGLLDQGIRHGEVAQKLFESVCLQAGVLRADIQRVVATGYGRTTIAWADKAITEITCHARGVMFHGPDTRTIIDIGGQDSKIIRLNERGHVQDFVMNDRCAAGTGRFLEVVAARLAMDIFEMGEKACQASQGSNISSMCVVFAETEIVGLQATGEPAEHIALGVQRAIAARICAMAGRKIADPIRFTGGVACIPGMAEALSQAIGMPVSLVPEPQFAGALGAALLAAEREG